MASRSIVIIGGGIIGTSTAYYLSRHPNVIGNTSVHVIEGSYIAAGSSGKGGGFLARDWHGPDTASLGALSYDLHENLAEEHGGATKWGYRKLITLGIDSDSRSKKKKAKTVPDAGWIADVIGSIDKMGDESTTAQVHPFQMTNTLISLAKENGVHVTIAMANGISFNDSDEVTGVRGVTESGEEVTIPATDVVFTAGPWTGHLAKRILGDKAGAAAHIVPSNRSTSIVVTPPPSREITPHALFCNVVLPDGSHAQPEIYPRPDGTLYVCGAGMSDKAPIPDRAADVVYSEEGVERLRERLDVVMRKEWIEEAFISGNVVKQACYRPDSDKTGKPVIGNIGNGLWLASGHQVWGILLGPGTGKVMAEMLLDGKAISANISKLQP